MTLTGYVSKLLGSRPFSAVATTTTRTKVRVLAYHGIGDLQRFEQHLEAIVSHFKPVTGRQVADAYRQDDRLPERAVWVTFDDGHPEVVTAAMPLLDACGIAATMYVCPAVIDTDEPFWWEIVRIADELDLTSGVDRDPQGGSLETVLKRYPDDERRRVVGGLREAVAEHGGEFLVRPQLTSGQLQRWVEHGHEVGNHSWDHPLLDRCSPAEQARQVNDAHIWLQEVTGVVPTSFAYPNGNWAAPTEIELTRLGYQVALGFDHRLAAVAQHEGLRMSRLRIDADAPMERFRAIASGVHPQLLAIRRRLLDRAAVAADPRELPR